MLWFRQIFSPSYPYNTLNYSIKINLFKQCKSPISSQKNNFLVKHIVSDKWQTFYGGEVFCIHITYTNKKKLAQVSFNCDDQIKKHRNISRNIYSSIRMYICCDSCKVLIFPINDNNYFPLIKFSWELISHISVWNCISSQYLSVHLVIICSKQQWNPFIFAWETWT